MWNELTGIHSYLSNEDGYGTLTVPLSASILSISCHATSAATLTIFGGSTIKIAAGQTLSLTFNHNLFVSKTNAQTVVFTGTDSCFIDIVSNGIY